MSLALISFSVQYNISTLDNLQVDKAFLIFLSYTSTLAKVPYSLKRLYIFQGVLIRGVHRVQRLYTGILIN